MRQKYTYLDFNYCRVYKSKEFLYFCPSNINFVLWVLHDFCKVHLTVTKLLKIDHNWFDKISCLQDSKDSKDSKDSSIPYADDTFKEHLLSSSSREMEGMREPENARNMVVHNRSCENHSSLENISVDTTNGSRQNRPIATIIPHNCIGGCEPGTRGQMKTGWL